MLMTEDEAAAKAVESRHGMWAPRGAAALALLLVLVAVGMQGHVPSLEAMVQSMRAWESGFFYLVLPLLVAATCRRRQPLGAWFVVGACGLYGASHVYYQWALLRLYEYGATLTEMPRQVASLADEVVILSLVFLLVFRPRLGGLWRVAQLVCAVAVVVEYTVKYVSRALHNAAVTDVIYRAQPLVLVSGLACGVVVAWAAFGRRDEPAAGG
jgi:hypothetical protein